MSLPVRNSSQDIQNNTTVTMTAPPSDDVQNKDMGALPPGGNPTPPPQQLQSAGDFLSDMSFANLAVALGVKSAEKTVEYQTFFMQTECTLQQKFAAMMGGVGGGSTSSDGTTNILTTPGGLYGAELHMQLDSANSAADALDGQAQGLINSSYVSLGSVGLSMTMGAAIGINPRLGSSDTCLTGGGAVASELAGKENLLSRLNNEDTPEAQPSPIANDADALPDGAGPIELTDSANAQPPAQTVTDIDARVDSRIQQWLGSEKAPEGNFSSYRAVSNKLTTEEDEVNTQAITKLRGKPRELSIVKDNLQGQISKLQERQSASKAQKLNFLTSGVISQASQAGSANLQAQGQENQATNTAISQKQSAEGQFFEKMIQQLMDLLRQFQQQANAHGADATSSIQQIAFSA